ncbi:hypothetical protein F2Q68_00044435 [Brassica cretica]|uniref:Uncharacterized protein n=1 Tax=Brassica cretica TaxID=69181 RepID=A0A8S9LR43_BRACR|nr:hypothetical protein F2Q68_00044435 [Brassica cretica]
MWNEGKTRLLIGLIRMVHAPLPGFRDHHTQAVTTKSTIPATTVLLCTKASDAPQIVQPTSCSLPPRTRLVWMNLDSRQRVILTRSLLR